MPYYEFKCENLICGKRFTVKHGINEAHPANCPYCGAVHIHQIYSPVPAIFKGSGFFTTDNKRDTRVKSASGQLGQRASEIGTDNMDSFSHQRSDSKGHAKVTPTRPGPKTLAKMAKDAEPS